jgi:hypothetical protein
MKRLLIPLASYLAVTILVPILNGAPIDAPFIEHAALTIIITGTLSPLLSSRNRTLHHGDTLPIRITSKS